MVRFACAIRLLHPLIPELAEMNTHEPRPIRQAGYMLLEVLVSVVIFSVGVLGLTAMQAISIKNDGAAKYRSEASALANELIGRMWADDRTPAQTVAGTSLLQTNYQGGPQTPSVADGPQYSAWLARIRAELPGVDATAGTLPRVTVVPVNVSNPFDPAKGKNLVTVDVRWHMPGDNNPDGTPVVHSYVAVAEIK